MSSMSDSAKKSTPPPNDQQVDWREQLFNGGETGTIGEVAISKSQIVRLRGIMLDLDLKLLRTSAIIRHLPRDANQFYQQHVRQWLQHHPVLSAAEVRNSGNGLHVLIWFEEPIEFETDEDRDHWEGVVNTIQCTLPIDPDQPSITALTRPLSSINGKNGALVTQLQAGIKLTKDEVLELYRAMVKSPFRTVFRNLTGSPARSPCPFCRRQGTRLDALDFVGKCYGGCGTVKLEQLYDLVLLARDKSSEVSHDAN